MSELDRVDQLLKHKDYEIGCLREYIERLEAALRAAISDDLALSGYEKANDIIRSLQYESGLKSDGRIR